MFNTLNRLTQIAERDSLGKHAIEAAEKWRREPSRMTTRPSSGRSNLLVIAENDDHDGYSAGFGICR